MCSRASPDHTAGCADETSHPLERPPDKYIAGTLEVVTLVLVLRQELIGTLHSPLLIVLIGAYHTVRTIVYLV